MRAIVCFILVSLTLLLVLPGYVAGQPNYVFLACEDTDEILRMSLDEPGYPLITFADAYELNGLNLYYPWAMAYHPDPQDPAYPNTDHLYVAGRVGNIVKIIIDRDTGEKVDAVELGPSFFGLRSLAFEPRTNRLYAGAHGGIHRYSEDVSSRVQVVMDPLRPPEYHYGRFFDECHLAFHPETGDLYAATGFNNEILIYSTEDLYNIVNAEDGDRLESYDGDFWWLPESPLFLHVGSEWQLLVLAMDSSFSILRFDPGNDVFLGAECLNQLDVSWNIDRSWATGDYYAGAIDYPMVRKVSSDFSSVTIIKDRGHPQLPIFGHLTVAIWPPPPLDTDGDGLSDERENGWGLNPNNTDTDGDGIKDSAEVGYDGDYENYDPYDPVTNPSGTDTDADDVDTDGGGEDDAIEIGKGRDPIDPSDDDNDDDGVPNLIEDEIESDREDPDSDDDGYTDWEEINHDGDPAYDPYDPGPPPTGSDTDPTNPDTDGDGFSDMVEIAGGSEPLVYGWTADGLRIIISFQPSGASRPKDCATDPAWPYNDARGYGWRLPE